MQRGLVAAVAMFAAVALLGACSNDDYADLPTSVPDDGPTTTIEIDEPLAPCDGSPGVGDAAPDGAVPGDLIEAKQLNDVDATGSDDGTTNEQTADFPDDAAVWRILYVSIGVDETDLELVCGLAAAPEDGPSSDDGVGHMLAWAHGTIGLQQTCLPSADPAKSFWGPMPGGIGTVAWGSGLRSRSGDVEDGALQSAIDRGWVVSATDYQPNDTYILGRVAGSNVIDAARATTQLMDQEFGDPADSADSAGSTDATAPAAPTGVPARYDTITWGHSQGGHAALWAGQLFESYQEVVSNPRSAELTLAGVAVEAPASNFVVQPDLQSDVELGDGLADWEMHKSIELIGLPIPALEIQVGPALFSYIFGSWAEFSAFATPAADARMPASPIGGGALDLEAVATEEGATTIARVQPLCLAGKDAQRIKSLVAPYRNAAANQMLVDELWNLPDDYADGQFFRGGTDSTCAKTEDADLVAWCDWIRWNIPGPLGDNPFPKIPRRDESPVPVLIAQGAHDQVIHCSAEDDADPSDVPPPSSCMSTALYRSLKDDGYCPSDGDDEGHLRLSLFRPDGSGSPGSHLSIPGQIAARGNAKDGSDVAFSGSPLDEFFTDAFDGELEPGCSATVLNAD